MQTVPLFPTARDAIQVQIDTTANGRTVSSLGTVVISTAGVAGQPRGMERGVAEGLLVGVILFRNRNGFGTRLALHRAEINLGFVGSVAVPLPLPEGISILDAGAVTIGGAIG